MISKKLSAVALCTLAAAIAAPSQAQDAAGMSSSTTSSTMSTTTTGDMSMSMSAQPTLVSGTVLRYYVDRSGYVTAMDVQTGEGVRMVRFSPGMAQRVYTSYPVGGQISGYVVGSGAGDMMRYDLVGVGDRMPAAGFMPAYTVSDVELLQSEPYIQAGAKMVQFKGKLRNVVTSDTGEVVGLVVSTDQPQNAAGDMAGMTPVATTGSASDILVRVPREFRHPSGAQTAGSMRVTPLFKGSDVEVVGYPEAPRYGVMSAYGSRVVSSALVVNGRAVGAIGIPKMMKGSGSTLFNTDIGGATDEEKRAGTMGYTTYGVNGSMGGQSMETTTSTTTTTQ